MERLEQRLKTAQRAISTLEDVLTLENPSTIVRDAAIQRFEYTFEAVWKTAKQYLFDYEGVDVGSPKTVIRSCFSVGLLDEDTTALALEMVDDRNMTVHTYNQSLADTIFGRIPSYSILMRQWLDNMLQHIK